MTKDFELDVAETLEAACGQQKAQNNYYSATTNLQKSLLLRTRMGSTPEKIRAFKRQAAMISQEEDKYQLPEFCDNQGFCI